MTSKTPYITINALIRYCFAKAPERSRIIRDFRDNEFPPFKGWYGGETEGAIRRFIATGGEDPEPLISLEQVLMKRETLTDHDEDKVLGQLHALEAVRAVDFGKIVKFGNPATIDDTLGPLFISGVRVSVRPTNVLMAEKEGQKALAVGVIKPYLASSDRLSDEAGLLYASLLHWYAEETMQHLGEADRRLAFVIDVFAGTAFQAPSAFKQRRDLLMHSCQEIYERWSSGAAAGANAKEA
jgi:hypothetical protein